MNKMEHSDKLYAGDLKGMGYIKNSLGRTSNICFYTSAVINTADNTATITYQVSGFDNMTDAFKESFTVYDNAVKYYNNQLSIWDGHRTEIVQPNN